MRKKIEANSNKLENETEQKHKVLWDEQQTLLVSPCYYDRQATIIITYLNFLEFILSLLKDISSQFIITTVIIDKRLYTSNSSINNFF